MKEQPIATRGNQELGLQSMYHTFNRQAAPRGTATHCTQTRDCCSSMAHGAFIFLSVRPRPFLSPSPSPLRRALGMRVADAGHGACAERRKVAAGRERVRYRSASASGRRTPKSCFAHKKLCDACDSDSCLSSTQRQAQARCRTGLTGPPAARDPTGLGGGPLTPLNHPQPSPAQGHHTQPSASGVGRFT